METLFGITRSRLLTHAVRFSCPLAMIGATIMFARPAFAQSAVLSGNVTSDSLGQHQLVGAEVAIPALSLTTRANFSGEYRFERLAAGRYLVVVQAAGYKSVGDSVTVAPSGETYHDFVVTTKVTQLDSVIATAASPARKYVSPALNAVEERRKMGFGHFLTGDELRKHDSERLSTVLRERIPGLQFVTVRGVDYAISGRNNDSGTRMFSNITTFTTPDGVFPFNCYATIYFDGVLAYDYIQSVGPQSNNNPRAPTVPAPPRIDEYNIDQLGAVEYYGGDATLPPGFRTQRGCGVLMLWTRER